MKRHTNRRTDRNVLSVGDFKVNSYYSPVVVGDIIASPSCCRGKVPPPWMVRVKQSARLQPLPPVPAIVIRDIKLAKELAKGGRIVQILADENLNPIESESDFRSKETVFSFFGDGARGGGRRPSEMRQRHYLRVDEEASD